MQATVQSTASRAHKNLPRRFLLNPLVVGVAALVAACGGSPSDTPSSAGSGDTNPTTPTVSAPTTEEGMASQIAYVARASSAVAASPGRLAQMAVLTKIIGSGGTTDIAGVAQAFSEASSEWNVWFGASSGNELDGQVKMFSLLSKALAGKLPRASETVLAAYTTLLDRSSQQSSPDSWWRTARNAKADEIIGKLVMSCKASKSASDLCDAVFRQTLGVSVTASFGEICAAGDVGACGLLSVKTMTKAQVVKAVTDKLTEANQKTSACVTADASCDDPGKTRAQDAEHIKNTIVAISKGAVFFGLIDETLAGDLKKVGGAAGDIYSHAGKLFDAFHALDPKSLKSLTQWSQWSDWIFGDGGSELSALYNSVKGIVSSTNAIAAAVGSVMDMFTDHGAKADPAVLQQLAELKRLLSQMREEMHERFDLVDTKLDKIFLTMVDGLGAIDGKLTSIDHAIAQVQLALGNLQQQVGGLSLTMQAYLADLSRQELNSIRGLVSVIDEAEFKLEEAMLFNYIINTTSDGLHAGPSNASWAADIFGELSRALGFTINALATYPAAVYYESAISGQRLANPSELVYAGQMYASLLQRYPTYTRNSADVVRSHLALILSDRVAPINATMVGIQSYPDLFKKLIDDYQIKAANLQSVIDNSALVYLQGAGTVGQSLPLLNMWGLPDQSTGYVPGVVRAGKVPSCSGIGGLLAMPAGWQALVSTASAQNAEALGLGTITACYEVGPGPGGWVHYQEIKIKPDRYWAWGVLAVTINTYFNGIPMRSRQLVAPAGSPYATSSICFYFTEDDIRVAQTAMPATTVVSAAWESTFRGNGWCGDVGYVPTNLKQVFDAQAVTLWDWATGAPDNKSALDAAIGVSLADLQAGFYGQVATQIRSATTIGAAARELAGAKLAIQRFLELGMPGLMANNYPVQSLFSGSSPLPDDVSVASLYSAAGAQGASAEQKVNFLADASAKSANLQAILDAAIGRLRRGETTEQLSELLAVQTQLELLKEVTSAAK